MERPLRETKNKEKEKEGGKTIVAMGHKQTSVATKSAQERKWTNIGGKADVREE